jgi:YjbE family integral membrane protein
MRLERPRFDDFRPGFRGGPRIRLRVSVAVQASVCGAMDFNSTIIVQILQIVWIDILLSGDNAVVIALACRQLPPHQRRIGVVLGAGAAVALRILFALVISYLMALPFLKVVGGLLLLWIAVKLVVGEDEDEKEIAASDKLWRAIWTIMIADAVMSLDNVIAISAASKGNVWLFVFGLALSIPLVIAGSTLVMAMIARFPIIVWAGAALLGWIAGEMLTGDVAVLNWLKASYPHWVLAAPNVPPLNLTVAGWMHYSAGIIGVAIVLAVGAWIKKRNEEKAEAH